MSRRQLAHLRLPVPPQIRSARPPILRLLSLHFACLARTELLDELINWNIAATDPNEYTFVFLELHDHFFEAEVVHAVTFFLK